MALEDFLVQLATIQLEPTPMPQDRLGGANRAATGAWTDVATDVPCLVRPMAASLQSRDDARRDALSARIYFAMSVKLIGLGTRHKITVDGLTYQVQGVVNINSLDELFHVDCELIANS